MTLAQLRPGMRLLIANIIMEFFYWDGDHPVFVHTSNGTIVHYCNKQYTRNTLLTEIK